MSAVSVKASDPPLLNISGIFRGHSWEIILQLTQDDETTVIPFSDDYTWTVYRDFGRKDLIFLKELPYTIDGMPIGLTTIENKLAAGTYHFDINNIIDVDTNPIMARGTLIIEP